MRGFRPDSESAQLVIWVSQLRMHRLCIISRRRTDTNSFDPFIVFIMIFSLWLQAVA